MGKYSPSESVPDEFAAWMREAFYYLMSKAEETDNGAAVFQRTHQDIARLRKRCEVIYNGQGKRSAEQFVPLWAVGKTLAQKIITGHTLAYVLVIPPGPLLKAARKQVQS